MNTNEAFLEFPWFVAGDRVFHIKRQARTGLIVRVNDDWQRAKVQWDFSPYASWVSYRYLAALGKRA